MLSFGDTIWTHFLDTLFSHSYCTQGLFPPFFFHEKVSVIGFFASEYSLAIVNFSLGEAWCDSVSVIGSLLLNIQISYLNCHLYVA